MHAHTHTCIRTHTHTHAHTHRSRKRDGGRKGGEGGRVKRCDREARRDGRKAGTASYSQMTLQQLLLR